MTWTTDQRAFMTAGEQTTDKFNPMQAGRYVKHIAEESRETVNAWLDGDVVKSIDGAVDVIVVAIGFMLSVGIDPEDAWRAVHSANMRKIVDGRLYKRADGQIAKPPGWYGPEAEIEALARSAGAL